MLTAPGAFGAGPLGPRPRLSAGRIGRPTQLAATLAALVMTLGACGGGGHSGQEPTAGAELGSAAGDNRDDDAGASTTTSAGAAASSTATTSEAPAGAPSAELLTITDVVVPGAAPTGIDACSQAVTYDAANLIDGQTDSAWRTPGDASGQWLTFHLDGTRRVLAVAVLPGYAKVDPCDGVDRWGENRRPAAVTWRFDDGSEVSQPLADSPTLQQTAVDVTTATVSLRIDEVTSDPVRDFTAISEVAVHGA